MSVSNVDNSGTSLRKVVKKSETFWRDDRDVVLFTIHQTDDVEVYTMYGVRKSTLGLGSEFLDLTFGGPQGVFESVSEMYEGLPTMRLLDDPADVDAFLHAIYFPGYLFKTLEEQKDPEVGLLRIPPTYPGILRLAEKLVAPPEVIRAVTSAFEELYSTFMRKWMDREGVLMDNAYDDLDITPNSEGQESAWDITRHFSDPVFAYNLAKGLPSLYNILPTVAYDIAHARATFDPSSGYPFRRIDITRLAEQDRQD
ncbi:hypothetical protein PENSPDRAFT_693335 [Peniophora sp. CONT]|nr:hypothetical protein PENSPDRAFT_693335 [Peniophora sp. CONT]